MATSDTPNDVGRLPNHLPGHFTESVLPSASIILPAVAGNLPNNLPGNFNDISHALDVPYNSVGFTLICRSARDFTTVLAVLYDYATMGYTEELSGVGAGSVTLDMDDPALLDQILADSVEDILAQDNLWEVYFDGERRFMWLGQNVQEPLVNASEDRLVTISGPGLGQSLEWGLILPNKFPAFRPKTETVVDDFTDQDVDIYGKWKLTGGTVQAIGGRVEVRVTAAGGDGSYLATDLGYTMVESGAQVRVVPAIGGNGNNGRIRTYLSLEASNGFARIYTDLDVDFLGYVLVAEVSNPPQIVRIPFNSGVHHYWRIQELDGVVIFSTRQENSNAWTTFAQMGYSFDSNNVRLRLQVNAVAGNITLPSTSYFSLVNVDGVAAPNKPMDRFGRLMQKCQARGSLKHIIPSWSPTHDSQGAAWVSDATVDVQVGADLLSVLNEYCAAIQADWFMDADYRLHVRQRIWSETGSNPSAPFHKEDLVIFREADSQESKDRRRAFGNVRNYVVGKTDSDEFLVKIDPESIASYQQREILVSDSQIKDMASLDSVLSNHLATVKDGTISWTLTVPFDAEDKRLYQDYNLGDWVSVQTSFPFRQDAWRIAAVAIQIGSDGVPTVELTLNDKMTPYWIKVREEIKRAKIPRPPRRGLPGISKNPGWYAA